MVITLKDIGKGSAHGKVILIGEHAVVYGKPAIALPVFSRKVEVTFTKIQGPIELITEMYSGPLTDAPNQLNGIKDLLSHLITELKVSDQEIRVAVSSAIPMNRGLGSSAAVSVAIIRAFYDYVDKPLTDELLRKHAFVAESVHHNNPSGLDVETVISDSAIYFIKGDKPSPLNSNLKGYLVIADSGDTGSTSQAVNHFKDVLHNSNKHDDLDLLGKLSEQSYQSIIEGDGISLGKAMNEAHRILKSFEVSTPVLDDMVSIALARGALGAKMTGSGLGGCMIALCENDFQAFEVSDALVQSGAKMAIITNLEAVNE